jgi:hypothetical protein
VSNAEAGHVGEDVSGREAPPVIGPLAERGGFEAAVTVHQRSEVASAVQHVARVLAHRWAREKRKLDDHGARDTLEMVVECCDPRHSGKGKGCPERFQRDEGQ